MNGSNPGKPSTNPAGNSPGNANAGGAAVTKPGNAATPSGGNAGGNFGGNAGGNAGPKSLPDSASPVADAATGKTTPGASQSPNSFGQSAAASAPAKQGPTVEAPGAPAVPAGSPAAAAAVSAPAAPPAATPVPQPAATTPTPLSSQDGMAAPPAPGADRRNAAPATSAARPGQPKSAEAAGHPPETAAPRPVDPQSPAAAALSTSQPQSTNSGDAGAVSGPAETVRAWLGNAANQVIEGFREALREVTLKELAVAALPGLAAVLFFFGSGIGLGHRQARYGSALQSTGAIRFAARGPLGVVRPGGFIAVPAHTAKTRKTSPSPRTRPVAGQRPRLVAVPSRAA